MPKTRRELPSEHKRGIIVDAACTLFTSIGYEASSMTAVAHQAAVAPNTIYWYFENKDALLVAAMDQLVDKAQTKYLTLDHMAFSARFNWLTDQFCELSGLLSAVHGRLTVSAPVKEWHDRFHRRISQFFVRQLMDTGLALEHAQSIVAIGLFLLEGMALHQADKEARAIAAHMLQQAIDSARAHAGHLSERQGCHCA